MNAALPRRRDGDGPDEGPHYEYGGATYVHWVLSTGVEQRMPLDVYQASAEPRIPDFVTTAFQAHSAPLGTEPLDWSRVQPKLLQHAMPFQREGIERGIRLGGRVLLADEMGLGKTIQALGILSYFCSQELQKKSLVICPASLCRHWANEVAKWTTLRPLVVLKGSQVLVQAAYDIVILSYNLIGGEKCQKWKELAAPDREWACIICDESHAFRDRTTQRTKSLTSLLTKQCQHVILISGTPQMARPAQLYSQLRFLLYPTAISWSAYTTRWCNGHFSKAFNQWDVSGATCTGELSRLLALRMVRRLADDVLQGQLPAMTRARVDLTLQESDIAAYKGVRADFITALETMQALSEQAKRSKLPRDFYAARTALFEVKNLKMKLYRETAAAKGPGAVTCIKRLYAATLPRATIVFFHHQVMLETLKQAFPGDVAVFIDGGTPAHTRQGIVDQVATGAKKLAFLSLTACCTGLNFTPEVACVVFAELGFNPSEMRQAEKRAHRIGAVHTIDVHYLIAHGTLDSNILEMNLSKFFVTNQTMADKRSRFDFTRTAFHVPLARLGINRGANMVAEDAQPLEGEAQDEYVQRVGVRLERDEVLALLNSVEPATEAMHELAGAASSGWTNLCECMHPAASKAFDEAWAIVALPLAKIAAIQEEPLSAVRLEMIETADVPVCACFIKVTQSPP